MRPEPLLLPLALAACLGGGGPALRGAPSADTAALLDCALVHATPRELLTLARGVRGHPEAARIARDVLRRPEAAACAARTLPPAPTAPAAPPQTIDERIDDALAEALGDADA